LGFLDEIPVLKTFKNGDFLIGDQAGDYAPNSIIHFDGKLFVENTDLETVGDVQIIGSKNDKISYVQSTPDEIAKHISFL